MLQSLQKQVMTMLLEENGKSEPNSVMEQLFARNSEGAKGESIGSDTKQLLRIENKTK